MLQYLARGVKSRFYRVTCRRWFHPGFRGLFLNPVYFARRGLRERLKRLAAEIRGTVLDVGCGSQPDRELFADEPYVGLECDTPAKRGGHAERAMLGEAGNDRLSGRIASRQFTVQS